MKNPHAIVLSGIFAALTVAMIVLSAYLSWIEVLFWIMVPVLSAVLCQKTDVTHTILSGVVALVIAAVVIDVFAALLFLPSIAMGVLVGTGLKKGYSVVQCVMLGTLSCIATFGVLFVLTRMFDGFSFGAMRDELIRTVDEVLSVTQTGRITPDVALRASIVETIDVTLMLLPSVIITSHLVQSVFALYIAAAISRRIGVPIVLPPFRDMIFPRQFSMTVALMMLFTLMLSTVGVIGVELSTNLQMIFLMPFAVAGCAVVTGLLHGRIPKLTVVVLLGIAIVFFVYPLVMLGIIDTIFDFRKVRFRNDK